MIKDAKNLTLGAGFRHSTYGPKQKENMAKW